MKHTMLYIFYLENMNIEIAFDAIPVKELTALSLSLSLSLSLTFRCILSILSFGKSSIFVSNFDDCFKNWETWYQAINDVNFWQTCTEISVPDLRHVDCSVRGSLIRAVTQCYAWSFLSNELAIARFPSRIIFSGN